MEGFEDLEATGYNVQLAYTLTGESRSYKLDGGKFDKIKPENKRTGAWESSTASTTSPSTRPVSPRAVMSVRWTAQKPVPRPTPSV